MSSTASVPCTGPTVPTGYEVWKRDLDRICLRHFSLAVDEIPGLDPRDAFDQGSSVAAYFRDAVVPNLRMAHGSFVDALLDATSSGRPEDPLAPHGA